MYRVAMDDADSQAAGTDETELPPTKKAKTSQTEEEEEEIPPISKYRNWTNDEVLTFLERRTNPRISKDKCKELLPKLLGELNNACIHPVFMANKCAR